MIPINIVLKYSAAREGFYEVPTCCCGRWTKLTRGANCNNNKNYLFANKLSMFEHYSNISPTNYIFIYQPCLFPCSTAVAVTAAGEPVASQLNITPRFQNDIIIAQTVAYLFTITPTKDER